MAVISRAAETVRAAELIEKRAPSGAAPDPRRAGPARRIGEVILDVRGISLAFGGVKALADISFDVREHEVRAMPISATWREFMCLKVWPRKLIEPCCGW